jgi:hypothetical protein
MILTGGLWLPLFLICARHFEALKAFELKSVGKKYVVQY